MRNIFAVMVLSAIIGCGLLFASKISFSEKVHDFGVVEQDAVLKHIFKFKNNGDGKLLIEKIKSG